VRGVKGTGELGNNVQGMIKGRLHRTDVKEGGYEKPEGVIRG